MSYADDTWDQEATEWAEDEFKNTQINDFYQISTSLLIKAKFAAKGDSVKCPLCRIEFVKKVKSQSFCSNSKSKKHGNCKDKYHNIMKIIQEANNEPRN